MSSWNNTYKCIFPETSNLKIYEKIDNTNLIIVVQLVQVCQRPKIL